MSRVLLGLLTALVVTPSFAAPQATPGQWEVTSKMTMEGMPMAIPPNTMKYCIKPEDAQKIDKQIAMGPKGQPNKDCKMVDQSVSGDTVKFHMRCEGQHATDVAGEMTYSGTTYQGKVTINADGGPQGKMKMTNTFNAKRLGDC